MKVFLIIFVLFISSCTSKISTIPDSHKVSNKKINEYQRISDIYKRINHYKYLAFSRCITVGLNNPKISKLLTKSEADFSEFQGLYVEKMIDSIVYETRNKIVEDSLYLARTWLRPDGEYRMYAGRKRVIAHCLDLYSSPELDSIVNLFKYNKNKPLDK